jgi:hypothetical protein
VREESYLILIQNIRNSKRGEECQHDECKCSFISNQRSKLDIEGSAPTCGLVLCRHQLGAPEPEVLPRPTGLLAMALLAGCPRPEDISRCRSDSAGSVKGN